VVDLPGYYKNQAIFIKIQAIFIKILDKPVFIKEI
jgi:hypothetical protein